MTGLWSTLDGVKVVELGQNIAGPYAASVLASFGADTIKIEPPGGDVTRTVTPRIYDDQSDVTAFFASVNVDKRYVCLDEKTPEGLDAIRGLAASADVFVQNTRPGRTESLGLGPDDLHELNPKLVYCSIVAFYPGDDRPGYDILVQAESGLMSLTGEPDRGPARLPAPILDYVSGLWVAMAASVALQGDRDRTTIRVSMLDVAMALLSDGVATLLAGGPARTRTGASAELAVPYGGYPTADGTIVIAAASDHLFARAAAALGEPIESDERFVKLADRLKYRADLDAALERVLRTRTSAEWQEALETAGVPVAVIREMRDAVDRHAVLSATGVRPVGKTSIVAPPVESIGERWEQRHVPGARGRHDSEVVATLLSAHQRPPRSSAG